MYRNIRASRVLAGAALLSVVLLASQGAAGQAPSSQVAGKSAAPADYVIGADDVLTITVYGQDPIHTGDVVVGPDGKIARLMIGEIRAAGLTPQKLNDALTKAYSKFFTEPMVLVTPKQINSRKVGITGNVLKPAEYPLNEEMNILGLIIKAGGLQEYAKKDDILLIRKDPLPNGKPDVEHFNYNKIGTAKIPMLRPGDQVVVK